LSTCSRSGCGRGLVLAIPNLPGNPPERSTASRLQALAGFLRHLPLPLVLIVYFLICGLLVYGLEAMHTGLHELIHGYFP